MVEAFVHTAKAPEKIFTYRDFMRVPVILYRTIGEDIFDYRSNNVWRRRFLRLLLIAGFLHFNYCVAGEIIFLVLALQSKETVLYAIAVAPCIGFSLVADFKHIALAQNKKLLHSHFDLMERIFPDTPQKQRDYKLASYSRTMHRVMVIFAILCLAYTSTFSMYPAAKSFVRYYFLGAETYERNFGFLIWYPYDTTSNTLVYWLTYCGQMCAAYLAGVAFLSADLLLVTSITQLNMHFNYISQQLSDYQPDASKDEEDMKFIGNIIHQHIDCLELVDKASKGLGWLYLQILRRGEENVLHILNYVLEYWREI